MTQLSQRMVELGTAKSEIREAFAFAQARAAEIGPENVDDFSIGNPSVPAPDTVAQMVHQLVDTVDPIQLHGYTPAQGDGAVRQALADEAFAAAAEKLRAFTEGEDYTAWLQAEAKTLAGRLGQGTVLYARPQDLARLGDLPAGCTAEADPSIELGGLRAENKAAHMAADDTLTSRLAAQRPWFLENAGLSIEL